MDKRIMFIILGIFFIASMGAICFQDVDKDGKINILDNCLRDPNFDQKDMDNDNVGDVCDNCQHVFNSIQEDADKDGFGDFCDPCPDKAGKENGCPKK